MKVAYTAITKRARPVLSVFCVIGLLQIQGCVSNLYNYRVTRMPVSCDQLKEDLSLINYVPDFYWDWHSQSDLDSLALMKAEHTALNAPSCVESWRIWGDLLAASIMESDSLVDSAITIYRNGLQVEGNHSLLYVRLALMYDYKSHYDSSEYYLTLAKSETLDRAVIDSMIEKFTMQDSLRILFERNPDQCQIELRRRGSYLVDPSDPIPTTTISGDGSMLMYDYYGHSDEPDTFFTNLTSSRLDSALALLEEASIVTLQNPFINPRYNRWEFEYVTQWHLPYYVVKIKTPSFSHSVSIYGLGTLAGDYALKGIPSISFGGPEMNTPQASPIGKRLNLIANAWTMLMSQEFVSDSVQARYGKVLQSGHSYPNYLYIVDSGIFVKLSTPDLGFEWRTPKESPPQKYPHRGGSLLNFIVDQKIYGLDFETGAITYTQDWNLSIDPLKVWSMTEFPLGVQMIAIADKSGTYFFENNFHEGIVESYHFLLLNDSQFVSIGDRALYKSEVEGLLSQIAEVRKYYGY